MPTAVKERPKAGQRRAPKAKTPGKTANPIVSTVEAADLMRALGNVLPFAGDQVPVLQLAADGQAWRFSATNRFQLGTWTMPVASEPFTATLPWAAAQHIRKHFHIRSKGARLTLAVDLAANTLRVSTDSPLDGPAMEATYDLPTSNVFPNFQCVLDKLVPSDLGSVGVNPAYLAAFGKVQAGSGEPMRLTFHGRFNGIRVDIGENFTGLLMPVRMPDEPRAS